MKSYSFSILLYVRLQISLNCFLLLVNSRRDIIAVVTVSCSDKECESGRPTVGIFYHTLLYNKKKEKNRKWESNIQANRPIHH